MTHAISLIILAFLCFDVKQPIGKIKRIFDQVTSFNCQDLTLSLQSSYSQDRTQVTQDLAFILENVSYEVTEIMVNIIIEYF